MLLHRTKNDVLSTHAAACSRQTIGTTGPDMEVALVAFFWAEKGLRNLVVFTVLC